MVRRPAVTAITPISLDHQAFLGDTLAAIAGEKAGILKPGVPGGDRPAAGRGRGGDRGPRRGGRRAALPLAPRMALRACRRGMRYEGERWRLDLPPPSLAGAHQIANAGTALACLEQLPRFSTAAGRASPTVCVISSGRRGCSAFAAARWSRRCRRLGILARRRPQPGAGEVLADAAGRLARPSALPVVGMLNTKDAAGSCAARAARRAALRRHDPGEENPLPAAESSSRRDSVGIAAAQIGIGATPQSAISCTSPAPMRILICGSLYFAGSSWPTTADARAQLLIQQIFEPGSFSN